MAIVSALGHSNGRLCGEMAAAIAAHVTQATEVSRPGRKRAQFYHYSTSTFENATKVLRDLGVIRPCARGDRPEETWYCFHELVLDCDQMPDYLARLGEPGCERMGQVLSLFIDVGCNYAGLSDERFAFAPPPLFARPMRGLAHRGYATVSAGLYIWTDRIGPIMQANYLWDDHLRSYRTVEHDALGAEAELAWRTMPATIRHAHFARRPIELLTFVRTLVRCWKDGAWHPTSQEPCVSVSGHIELARRIVELANGRR